MNASGKKNAILIGVSVVLVAVGVLALFRNSLFPPAAPPPSAADDQAAAAVSTAVHADQAPIDDSPPTAPRGSGRLAGRPKK